MHTTANSTVNHHGSHTHSLASTTNGLEHQLLLAYNDPSGHLLTLLAACGAVAIGLCLLGRIAALVLTATSPQPHSSGSGDTLTMGAAKIAGFILAMSLPGFLFSGYFDQGRAAVMGILGAGS